MKNRKYQENVILNIKFRLKIISSLVLILYSLSSSDFMTDNHEEKRRLTKLTKKDGF